VVAQLVAQDQTAQLLERAYQRLRQLVAALVQPLQRVVTVVHRAVVAVVHSQAQARAQRHLFKVMTVVQVFLVLTVLLVVVVVQAKQATQTLKVSAVTVFHRALAVQPLCAVVAVAVQVLAVQHQKAERVAVVTAQHLLEESTAQQTQAAVAAVRKHQQQQGAKVEKVLSYSVHQTHRQLLLLQVQQQLNQADITSTHSMTAELSGGASNGIICTN
jgi:hypothetical protein